MWNRIIESRLLRVARTSPVITITGPRQSGKTTLIRTCFSNKAYFTLENPDTRQLISSDPRGWLATVPQGALIDEVQRYPEICSYIQGRVDEPEFKAQGGLFVLTGSEQFTLSQTISQSLAGRSVNMKLLPLQLNEIEKTSRYTDWKEELLFGSYPRVRADKVPPREFYPSYFENYVQRDLRNLSKLTDLTSFTTFTRLAAAQSAQLLNLSSLGNLAGITSNTAKSWIGLLETGYIVFRIEPHFVNISKRIVKSPKLYWLDSGLLCNLLQIIQSDHIQSHPSQGSLFENWIVSEFWKWNHHQNQGFQFRFIQDKTKNEIDLLAIRGEEIHAIEIKASATPNISFLKNIELFESNKELKFTTKTVIYTGESCPGPRSSRFVNWQDIPKLWEEWTISD